MSEYRDVFVERVRDEGHWFGQGLRVELSRATAGRPVCRIDKAVFGTYEVLSCTREQDDGQTYLTVRLRRFAHR